MDDKTPEKEIDYEVYKQLLELWAKENPIKTNKLQVLLVVNGLLLTALNVSGGFIAKNWPIYLGGALLSLVWVLSIGRTSLFQAIWETRINKLAEKYPTDDKFQILRNKPEYRKGISTFLQITGSVPSKYYLVGAPFVFFLAWSLLFFYFAIICP